MEPRLFFYNKGSQISKSYENKGSKRPNPTKMGGGGGGGGRGRGRGEGEGEGGLLGVSLSLKIPTI